MAPRLIWPFILLQVAAVAAIILFLRMLLHKQLEIGVRRIQKLDQENLKKEAALNQRLKQLDKEYESKIKDAEKETQSMIEMAKESIKKMREEERIKTKEESKRLINSALQEREKLEKEARHKIFNKGIDLSALILKRVFSESELDAFKCKVSREVMNFLISSDQVGVLLKNNKELEVVTQEPLSESDKKHLLKIIEDKSSKKAKVKFSIDKEVLGGFILKIGGQIIDGSIAYRINKAAVKMREEMKY